MAHFDSTVKTRIAEGTFFETAVVRVPASALRPMSALESVKWEGSPKIDPDDVWNAVAANHFPFMDRMGGWQTCDVDLLNYGCSYEDHVQRIAWLVKYWDDAVSQANHPIMLKLDEGCGELADGNHRAVAAILRDEANVTVEVISGSLDLISQRIGDAIEWVRRPVGFYFGSNLVVSSCGDMWEVDYSAQKLWINNVKGFCQLQLSCGQLFSSARIVSSPLGEGKSKFLTGAELTIDAIIDGCVTLISPVFESDIFQALIRKHFPHLGRVGLAES